MGSGPVTASCGVAKGIAFPDCEQVSPNASEPASASLRNWVWPTCQRWRSLPPAVKQRARATAGHLGVVGEGALGQSHRGTWEARHGGDHVTNVWGESITGKRPCRESERPIVAEKRGNSRGAKGPCLGDAESDERSAAWSIDPLRNNWNCGSLSTWMCGNPPT